MTVIVAVTASMAMTVVAIESEVESEFEARISIEHFGLAGAILDLRFVEPIDFVEVVAGS
jgi:pyruvate/2-oxoglutarate/acetoin dehydrogenase E1 component